MHANLIDFCVVRSTQSMCCSALVILGLAREEWPNRGCGAPGYGSNREARDRNLTNLAFWSESLVSLRAFGSEVGLQAFWEDNFSGKEEVKN